MEKKGNLCSGVNRSIVLGYCEDLEENYSNCRIIMELLRVDEPDSVIAADYKLLNVLRGLSGQGESLPVFTVKLPKAWKLA